MFKEEYEYEVYDEDAMLDQGQRLVGAKAVNSDDYPFAVAWTPNFRGRFIFFNLIMISYFTYVMALQYSYKKLLWCDMSLGLSLF